MGGKSPCFDVLLRGENDGPGAVEAKVEVVLGVWLECLHFCCYFVRSLL